MSSIALRDFSWSSSVYIRAANLHFPGSNTRLADARRCQLPGLLYQNDEICVSASAGRPKLVSEAAAATSQ
jgi:hypothetical protein